MEEEVCNSFLFMEGAPGLQLSVTIGIVNQKHVSGQSHTDMSVNHSNIIQCDVGSIPGHVDTPSEAKDHKVKAKCQTIQIHSP